MSGQQWSVPVECPETQVVTLHGELNFPSRKHPEDRLGTYTYFPSQRWVRDPVLIRISFRFSLARRSVSQATPRGAELVEVLEGGAQGLDQLQFESGLQDFPDGWLGKWLLLSVPWFPHLPF